jgi:Sulfatase
VVRAFFVQSDFSSMILYRTDYSIKKIFYDFADGLATPIGTVGTSFALPFDREFGPYMISAVPGYFEQHPDFPDVDWCPFIQSVSDDILTSEEKFIACKTRPRTLPKLLDLDLLDKVVEQITTHDYTKGPILQYFSTALLHQPISYPKEYDVNASDTLPKYFQPGKIKPLPSNDDYRMTINQAVRYLDDIFGSTMQAIKDAGQWNNTIVYFTSDNGGPIYTAAAMNNYPLRGMKFTPFEGGTRVVQFMTGGWINQNLPANRRYKSDTNIFANDIAPTLLEMVGADVSFLLGENKGAPYGNPMWTYIQNSVDQVESPTKPKQKVRKVVISKEFFFDVQPNRTLKNIFTGNIPMATPRLWKPIWPKTGDLLMYVCELMLILPCVGIFYRYLSKLIESLHYLTGIQTIVL